MAGRGEVEPKLNNSDRSLPKLSRAISFPLGFSLRGYIQPDLLYFILSLYLLKRRACSAELDCDQRMSPRGCGDPARQLGSSL